MVGSDDLPEPIPMKTRSKIREEVANMTREELMCGFATMEQALHATKQKIHCAITTNNDRVKK